MCVMVLQACRIPFWRAGQRFGVARTHMKVERTHEHNLNKLTPDRAYLSERRSPMTLQPGRGRGNLADRDPKPD